MSIALGSARMLNIYRRLPISFSRARSMSTAKEDSGPEKASSKKKKKSKDAADTSKRLTPADFQRIKDTLAEIKEKQMRLRELHITEKIK